MGRHAAEVGLIRPRHGVRSGPVDQERVSGVASPTSCDDETMAVALGALLIPTDVRDHSGRSGLSAFGLACLLRDARLRNPLPLLEFRDVQKFVEVPRPD
jgi:hypothetical protein